MIEADDTLPKRNLGEGEPWGRVIEDTVKELVKGFKGQSLRVSNVSKSNQAALDLGAVQGQQIVVTQDSVTETQAQQTATKQIDSTNLFDLTPLVTKDVNGWYAEAATMGQSSFGPSRVEPPNITEWYEDGFKITALEAGYVFIANKERYRNTGPMFATSQVEVIRNNPTSTWLPGQNVTVGVRAYSGDGRISQNLADSPPIYQLIRGAYFTGADGKISNANADRQDWINRPSFNNPSLFLNTTTLTNESLPVVTWTPFLGITFTAAGQTATIRNLQVRQIPADAGVIGQPGVNLFDTNPIVVQDTYGWYVQNLLEFNWITNGIQARTPFWDAGLGMRSTSIYTRKYAGVKPDQVLTMSVDLGFSTTANGAEANGLARAGFTWTFYNDDGAIQAATATGSTDQNGTYTGSATVPLGATSVRISLTAWVPANYPNPQGQVWVKFRNPYFGLRVDNSGYKNGSITQDKLDPSITFGVADGSLTTAKYQDGSVTNPKIAGPIDASKVASGYPIANTSGNLPATRLTGPILNSQIGGSQVDTPQLTTNITDKLTNAGSFRNIITNPDLTGSYQSLPNTGWYQLTLPALTNYTRKNTLNDGSAATITSNFLVAPKTGRYLVNVAVRFAGNSNGTARGVSVQVANGPRQMENSLRNPFNGSLPNFPIPMTCSVEVEATAGQAIQPTATQNSGAALDCRLETFTVSYLGPA